MLNVSSEIDSFVAFGVISACISHNVPDLKGVLDFLIAAVCHSESQNHHDQMTHQSDVFSLRGPKLQIGEENEDELVPLGPN